MVRRLEVDMFFGAVRDLVYVVQAILAWTIGQASFVEGQRASFDQLKN